MESIKNCYALISNGNQCVLKATHLIRENDFIIVYQGNDAIAFFATSDIVAIYLSTPLDKK